MCVTWVRVCGHGSLFEMAIGWGGPSLTPRRQEGSSPLPWRTPGHDGPRHLLAREEHLACVGRNRTYVVNTLMCECTPVPGNTCV